MKKINSSGFVLAETLVVTVFLMMIFAMIYSNFYPLIGEYEKREVYDTVDGKYAIYWVKRMIEDGDYIISTDNKYPEDTTKKAENFKKYGFVRFECKDIINNPDKRDTCVNLVKALEIDGCDSEGNYCEAYITRYKIGNAGAAGVQYFKNAVKGMAVTKNGKTVYKSTPRYRENCPTTSTDAQCQTLYEQTCDKLYPEDRKKTDNKNCKKSRDKKLFKSGFTDYVNSLPDYTSASLNNAKYRVIVSFHNLKDNNNYYSYATIEVSK